MASSASINNNGQRRRTYLRVKRRRSSVMASSLRLEASSSLGSSNAGLAGELVHSLTSLSVSAPAPALPRAVSVDATSAAPTNSQRRKAVLWKRVQEAMQDGGEHPVHFVNAVLLDEEEEDEEDVSSPTRKKRRRLTLLPSAIQEPLSASLTKNNSQSAIPPPPQALGRKQFSYSKYKVLNPLQRLVDDSLTAVLEGTVSAAQHVEFCTTDARLADAASTKWLPWNSAAGNLLHACALWNDAETTRAVLSRPNIEASKLLEAVDAEGRTPYEIAAVTGHVDVAQVLEAFGTSHHSDNDSFVFDVYCLEEGEDMDENGGGDSQAALAGSTTLLELHGGYWNSEGQLVIGASPEAGAERYLEEEEMDHDSNNEDWSGNDYPDEDAANDSSDDDEVDVSFRRRPMIGVKPDPGGGDNLDDGVYDAAYGMGALQSSEPEYDREI